MSMKKNFRFALAFAALAGMAGASVAAEQNKRENARNMGMLQFERADADSSGDVTLEEFSAAMSARFRELDANSDGKVTVEEVAAAIENARAERIQRMAERFVSRFDADDDGGVSAAEFETGQERVFARLDRNDDGKIEKSEMRSNRERAAERRKERAEAGKQAAEPAKEQNTTTE